MAASSKDSEKQDSMDHSTEVSYEGSCHCRAVCFSTKLPSPLPHLTVISCNCAFKHHFYVHKINVRFVYIDKLCKNICN